MLMKFTNDTLLAQGIAYVARYPYNELNRTSPEGKRHYTTLDFEQPILEVL